MSFNIVVMFVFCHSELSTGSPCGLRGSPLKDGLSAAASEKHRREVKQLQETIENVSLVFVYQLKSSAAFSSPIWTLVIVLFVLHVPDPNSKYWFNILSKYSVWCLF